MSTLQDRLRSRNGNPAGYGLGPVCDEAADELDRLQAECEHLRADRDLEKKIRKDYVDALEAMRAENEVLRLTLKDLHSRFMECAALSISAAEAYDSFYQDMVQDALK